MKIVPEISLRHDLQYFLFISTPTIDIEPKGKSQTYVWLYFMLALPIFPGSHPPSIVGANELNFCVRDGNRWTLAAINTNYKW